ncbi:vWA domain-containing protein [Flavihumibacter fluvii]|uniref:vWA domain-containing protein n=1 Tax=Flavihumibacter fluvii TaxID=2838157 RepID=UPI001BDF3AC6|nr:VWA domain-containing protein [Flavihumibacter fluvii]ULQ51122.1 VWA domain-containing protein [Flavihumibacter fluvii]
MITRYFDSIHFAWPWVMWGLLFLPLLFWWYLKKNQQRSGSFIISSTAKLEKLRRSWKARLAHVPFILRLLSLACILLALARPQTRFSEEQVSGEGVDIILCVDVSGSMLAQDFTPNRLEAAKDVAANFVDSRKTDRVGVVIFSGESFTLCPLTTDKAVLKAQIYNIQSGLLEDGTAIGSGLATSTDRLRSSKSKSKVVILLTDGENNGGQIPPVTAKEIAKKLGIRVYTIGVGTEGYAPIPVQANDGSIVMQREKVNIDEKLLTQIADETNGKYFRAKDNEGLEKIYTEIDQLEKSRIEVTSLQRSTERFLPLVIAAILFLFLEWLLRLTLLKKFP